MFNHYDIFNYTLFLRYFKFPGNQGQYWFYNYVFFLLNNIFYAVDMILDLNSTLFF